MSLGLLVARMSCYTCLTPNTEASQSSRRPRRSDLALSSLHRPSFIFDPDDVFQKYLISGEASTFITCDCSSLVPQRGPPK
ncbi:hypothetical protein CGCF415_v008703 [Colletotrichum fructicola]|uniref:Uncharacterized protein n=1 Tax=Colletotrichum fructicola (strain Nara gc5) TaxID=1213859 RepID=A0A7J6IKT9_COLFN|nr:hypothetical protein CFRS1_v001649 [Colletotrichum fructicola]KAF4477358.1 hypothetical protein CGGC5_v013884 [Colletotrichum fructicola Nara gc5]KAF4884200.1 hypothetical protein CGCFRS4_v012924 [Colletotrichum fructicola]KAF4904445.1 hypothetical protein CGCF415_v008703 [Colletotrichum fructicola]KAF4942548.1 hypothetical protein CGCF245_v000680 [Colletotrichum fructicola]